MPNLSPGSGNSATGCTNIYPPGATPGGAPSALKSTKGALAARKAISTQTLHACEGAVPAIQATTYQAVPVVTCALPPRVVPLVDAGTVAADYLGGN